MDPTRPNVLQDRATARYRWLAVLCFLCMCILSIATIWVNRQMQMPAAGVHEYFLSPDGHCFVWYDLERFEPGKPIASFDFETQSIELKQQREYEFASQPLANGQRAMVTEYREVTTLLEFFLNERSRTPWVLSRVIFAPLVFGFLWLWAYRLRGCRYIRPTKVVSNN